uniref:Uncharacterized protein n=1 Tax=Arundo donax TaxID=35708 RepID=A0A0A9FND3_ARUDO
MHCLHFCVTFKIVSAFCQPLCTVVTS